MSPSEPERCGACGFDGSRLTVADSVAALRSLGPRWRRALHVAPDDVLRRRPEPQTWSALEYAAHTRDVIAANGWGMHQALEGSGGEFPSVEPDPLGADHGWNALDPELVLAELASNAERMAARAQRARPDIWGRTVRIGDADVDAGWILRHVVHDATHHLKDVERGLRALGVT